MSNFLLTLAVVLMSLAAATAVAIKDPNQPATLRARRPREKQPRHPPRTATDPAAGGSWDPGARRTRRRATRRTEGRVRDPAARPLRVPAPVDAGGFSDHWLPAPTGPTIWLRLRSGFALTVLLTVVGTVMAVAVAGIIVFLALALQSAVS